MCNSLALAGLRGRVGWGHTELGWLAELAAEAKESSTR